MSSIAFDTLAYSKTLREAGFSEKQAEALANAQNNAFAEMVLPGSPLPSLPLPSSNDPLSALDLPGSRP